MDSNHRYPAKFFGRPSIPAQFTFRNINRLPRDRDRWFESISLQRGVTCEPEFSLALAKRGGWSGVDLHQLSVGQSSPPSGQFGIAELGGFPLIIQQPAIGRSRHVSDILARQMCP